MTSHSDYSDQSKLDKLCWDAAQYIDEIYEHFNIEVKYRNNMLLKSCCPIHGGDNPMALNMYPFGDHVVHWKCRTHNCESKFGRTLIGFVRGCISHAKYKYGSPNGKEASFKEAVEFLLSITNQTFDSIAVQKEESICNKRFSSMIWTMIGDRAEYTGPKITRDFYRKHTTVPAQYYLDRGYSPDILDKYDVGFCNTPGKQMYKRAIVPIYDNNHEYIVGFTGRSIYEECKKCGFHHENSTPCKFYPKWRHSEGFQKEQWLYNYWYAKDHIKRSKTAIIVESPGNIWRLEEAGIHIGVAIFGTALNSLQKDLLDEMGALSLIIVMDPDEPGQLAARRIIDECKNQYRIFNIDSHKVDLGDMKTDEINSYLDEIINQCTEYYK